MFYLTTKNVFGAFKRFLKISTGAIARPAQQMAVQWACQ